MLRVFVVANDSILADAIAANIGQQADLARTCGPTRENCLALILVEDGSEVAG